MTVTVDVRCPVHPVRLFMKIGGPVIVAGNLIEVACDYCRKDIRRQAREAGSEPPRVRVLHRYNVLGELIETDIITAEE